MGVDSGALSQLSGELYVKAHPFPGQGIDGPGYAVPAERAEPAEGKTRGVEPMASRSITRGFAPCFVR